jgi:amino acid transporter
MVLPMALIIGLGVFWIASGKTSHIEFTATQMLPHFDNSGVWVSLTTIMASYLGIELAVVHARDVKNPQKTFPKALAVSAVLIVATMMLGSLSIAIVLPHDEISLVAGVMQAFSAFFSSYHWGGILPWVTFMIVLGSIGGMVNWIISPVKGLLFAAQDEQLPAALTQKNKNGVPARLLILQAIIVSLVSMVFLLLPSVNSSYWFLTALSTELYMLMYVILFLAAIRLRYSTSETVRPFKVPGGNVGMWITGLFGIAGCGVTLVVGFFPPESIFDSGGVLYDLMFIAGLLGMCVPPFFLIWIKRAKSILAPVPLDA